MSNKKTSRLFYTKEELLELADMEANVLPRVTDEDESPVLSQPSIPKPTASLGSHKPSDVLFNDGDTIFEQLAVLNNQADAEDTTTDADDWLEKDSDDYIFDGEPDIYRVSAWRVGVVLIGIVLSMLWFKQHSLASYVQQTYQITPFWQHWTNPVWQAGGQVNGAVNQLLGIAEGMPPSSNSFNANINSDNTANLSADELASEDITINSETNELGISNLEPSDIEISNTASADNLAIDDITPPEILADSTLSATTPTTNTTVSDTNDLNVNGSVSNTTLAANAIVENVDINKAENGIIPQPTDANDVTVNIDSKSAPTHLTLSTNKKVFFVGDSLMEGVAPRAMRLLRKEHGIKSINLSKQNTGLSYSNFFDWPKNIKETFAKHDDIGLMVVMLGANDPWDVPNPKNPAKYVKFNTKKWDALYQAKIRGILETAHAHDAKVMWMLMPAMKKRKLNKQVTHLNTLYLDSLAQFAQISADDSANIRARKQPKAQTDTSETKVADSTENVAKPVDYQQKSDSLAPSDKTTDTDHTLIFATQPLLSDSGLSELTDLTALTEADKATTAEVMTFAMNAKINGKLKKARTSDGIHFSISGQKRLAEAIVHFIKVTPE